MCKALGLIAGAPAKGSGDKGRRMDGQSCGWKGRGEGWTEQQIGGKGEGRTESQTEMYKVSSQSSVLTTVVVMNVRKSRSLHKCRHSSVNSGKGLRSPGYWGGQGSHCHCGRRNMKGLER